VVIDGAVLWAVAELGELDEAGGPVKGGDKRTISAEAAGVVSVTTASVEDALAGEGFEEVIGGGDDEGFLEVVTVGDGAVPVVGDTVPVVAVVVQGVRAGGWRGGKFATEPRRPRRNT